MSSDENRRLVLELLGDGATQAELPRAGVLTIGSEASKVSFRVVGQGVSDVHCAIGRAKGGGFALKDLGSEYGTWVNGERVQQAKLDVGDLILVGSRRLRVVDPAAPPVAAPAAPQVAPAAAPTSTKAAATPASTAAAAPAKIATSSPAPAKPSPVASAPLEEASAKTTPRPATGGTTYEHTPLPKIPGYRIEKLLGRGGMGEVFLATQERLDRKVALKLLSAKLCADADFVRRFKDEARAAAALSHPNVVVVHDVGEEAGRHYLSMEFMDKGTLENRVARGARMPWIDVLGVLHDMASALVYAESRGIVHRDLKPANMMQGAAGATKLADLGLATHLEAEATVSENEKIFGTPHFIAPEQARGERVDGRADLYSLGATAYRLLSGRTPFEGATTRDILRGHFFETPKPLSEIDPALPVELVRIVERLLQKKPEDRFPSAAVLLKEVDRVRATLVHTDVVKPAAGNFPKRAAALVALLVIGLLGWKLTRPQSPVAPTPPLVVGGNPTPPTQPEVVEPPPKPVKPGPGRDDDIEIQLHEAKAKIAWKDLPSDLAPLERATRLEQLAQEYAGTTAATDMQTEASKIRATLDQQTAASAEALQRRQAALSGLVVSEALLDSPSSALEQLNGYVPPAELSQDPLFMKARTEVYGTTVSACLQHARAAVAAIDAAAAKGDFEAVRKGVEQLLPKLQLPALPADIDPNRLADLAALQKLAADLATRSEGLDSERVRFSAGQVDGDRKRVALELGVAAGFDKELAQLDFAALHERFSRLETSLVTDSARTLAHDLDADLTHARAALRGVAAQFPGNGWKRKQIADPRSSKSTVRTALAIDDTGITLDVDGKPELVAWSSFGAKPRELSFLFTERLTRPYTEEETRGIEALLRLSAVAFAIDAAS
ncbi:MAG TPA: FHA domain-containing serine/threonine-protein kinase [Planctomycetota bacterium]|nr:FHA domain-containing serine/threonine-protein kinase [Planctomycetota bacterium]